MVFSGDNVLLVVTEINRKVPLFYSLRWFNVWIKGYREKSQAEKKNADKCRSQSIARSNNPNYLSNQYIDQTIKHINMDHVPFDIRRVVYTHVTCCSKSSNSGFLRPDARSLFQWKIQEGNVHNIHNPSVNYAFSRGNCRDTCNVILYCR